MLHDNWPCGKTNVHEDGVSKFIISSREDSGRGKQGLNSEGPIAIEQIPLQLLVTDGSSIQFSIPRHFMYTIL